MTQPRDVSELEFSHIRNIDTYYQWRIFEEVGPGVLDPSKNQNKF